MFSMADFIVIGILIIMVGAAIVAIRRAKKNGARCMGCSAGCSCPAKKNSCECHSDVK